MPETTPITRAIGTMMASTQNIKRPVARSDGPNLAATLTLNFVEQPKSPSSTPEKTSVEASSQY